MRLYTFAAGPFPKRVLLYITLKSITGIEIVNVDIFDGSTKTPQFLEMSPAGSVPVLMTDTGVCISQSMPIIEYLEELFPSPCMSGRTEAERRRVGSLCQLINEIFYYSKVALATTVPYLEPYQHKRVPEAAFVGAHLEWSRFEQISHIMRDGPYLAGDTRTIADVLLFPVVEYTRPVYDRFMPPHLRNLAKWYARMERESPLPAYEVPEGYHRAMSGGRV